MQPAAGLAPAQADVKACRFRLDQPARLRPGGDARGGLIHAHTRMIKACRGFRPVPRRYSTMAAPAGMTTVVYGWDEDQRRTLAQVATLIKQCLTYQALLDIVSITYSEPLNSDPTREYGYDQHHRALPRCGEPVGRHSQKRSLTSGRKARKS